MLPSLHMNLPSAVQDATPPFLPLHGLFPFAASALVEKARAISIRAMMGFFMWLILGCMKIALTLLRFSLREQYFVKEKVVELMLIT